MISNQLKIILFILFSDFIENLKKCFSKALYFLLFSWLWLLKVGILGHQIICLYYIFAVATYNWDGIFLNCISLFRRCERLELHWWVMTTRRTSKLQWFPLKLLFILQQKEIKLWVHIHMLQIKNFYDINFLWFIKLTQLYFFVAISLSQKPKSVR